MKSINAYSEIGIVYGKKFDVLVNAKSGDEIGDRFYHSHLTDEARRVIMRAEKARVERKQMIKLGISFSRVVSFDTKVVEERSEDVMRTDELEKLGTMCRETISSFTGR